ncbi:SUN domain-containing protein 1-like [Diospyros lotus]|uniref:SUN domain-containing protein 1-like n=1 Tax=Diospyros lotus TaxID=55363 RepID=UPI0022568E2F|nr:SUN domain-containing protein 1-like [Diospyros lotus]
MSASTVSITANTAARRRPVVAGDKKTGIELVTTDHVAAATAATSGDGDDKLVSNGKDLSHSIRGESVLERSRDAVQIKKLEPRRTNRKAVTKPEKPRWHTVISIFTKNVLLLLVLVGLAQMIRRLVLNPDNAPAISSSPSTEFERRIAEVEAFLKTTTKMMQVQVEVVDKKIENEVSGLRLELNKKIEATNAELGSELKKLDGRTGGLEKTFGEFRSKDWLAKEDFEKFVEEFKKAKGTGNSFEDVKLDEIRAFAREIVEREIAKHAADGLGRVDYALASGGAMVVKHSEAFYGAGKSSFISLGSRNGVHKDAQKMLRPSFGEPGQCFPFKGSSGFLQIKLRTAIIPEAITLEHVDKSVAYDRSSAPRDCRVSGWLQGDDPADTALETEKKFLLTEFTYDLEKSNAQTFDVLDTAGFPSIVDMIRLDFTSNYGSPHTCIYRVRVHGHEPSSVSMLPMQQG